MTNRLFLKQYLLILPLRAGALALCIGLAALCPALAQDNLELLEKMAQDTNQSSTADRFTDSKVDRAVSVNVQQSAEPPRGVLSVVVWGLTACLAGGGLALFIAFRLRAKGKKRQAQDRIQVKDVKKAARRRSLKESAPATDRSAETNASSRPARPQKDPFPSDIYTQSGDKGKIPPRRRA